MADKKLTQESTLTKSTIATGDLLYVADISASSTKGITYQELVQPLDSQFAVADNSDPTKKVAFQVSGVTTGTTRTLTVPDADTTIVGTNTTDTLSNKTLTAPQINFGSDARGDLMTRNSLGVTVRLPVGTTGQILQTSSVGDPEWVANPSAADATYTVKGVDYKKANSEYYAADAGSTDAYAITLSPALNAYAVGQTFRFKANTVNTGAATLAINGLAAITIVKGVSTTLSNGDIAAGQVCTVTYNGTNFVLQNPTATAFNSLFTNGNTTKLLTDASATQTIAHGLGVVPKKVKITAMYTGTTGVSANTVFSVYNGTTQSSLGFAGSNTGSIRHIVTALELSDLGSGNDTQIGVITADATNISIAWTKSGTPSNITYNILWEAEA